MCSPHSMHYCSSATIIMFDSSKGYENVKHCNKARNQATLLKIMNFKSSLHHLKFNREPSTYQESFVSINTKKNIGVLVSGVFGTPVHVWFCKELKNVFYCLRIFYFFCLTVSFEFCLHISISFC